MARVRRKVTVSGRVQGVFYRDTCRRRAEGAGVAGSARNLADGRVEIVLEGEEDAVDELVTWCREGPPHARVEDVTVASEEPEGLESFRVV